MVWSPRDSSSTSSPTASADSGPRRRTPTTSIVLDIMLPGMNGYDVLKQLRQRKIWTPVLMLTAKDGDYDQTDAFDLGADDYLTKPFSFMILMARLRALVRRGAPERPVLITAGTLVLDPARRVVARRRRSDTTDRPGVRIAAVSDAARRRRGQQSSDPRQRMGLGLRGQRQHRRGLHRLSPQETGRTRSTSTPSARSAGSDIGWIPTCRSRQPGDVTAYLRGSESSTFTDAFGPDPGRRRHTRGPDDRRLGPELLRTHHDFRRDYGVPVPSPCSTSTSGRRTVNQPGAGHRRTPPGPILRLARHTSADAVLAITAAVGGLLVLGLTSASAWGYDAVVEKDGVAGLDRPILDQAIAWRTPHLDRLVTGFTHLGGAYRHDDHRHRHHRLDGVAMAVAYPADPDAHRGGRITRPSPTSARRSLAGPDHL